MNDRERQLVRIAVTLPVRDTFSYSVPENFLPFTEVGCRVLVPFRNRKVLGYILEREEATGEDETIRDILDVLDPEPLFPPDLVPFFKWMADYYLYPLGRLIQSALPGGLNVTPEKGLPPSPGSTGKSQDRGNRALMGGRSLKRPVGHLKRRFIRIRQGADLDGLLAREQPGFRAKNEREFLEALAGKEGISLKEVSSMFKNGPYLIKKWTRAGLLEGYDAVLFRDPSGNILAPSPEPPLLYDQQEEALLDIRKRLERGKYSTCLLHGVTGSGKTEVYFQAVKQALRLGKRAILLAPEIALATYINGIFRSRLGGRVALFHSGLSLGERYDQWIRMLRGEVDIVIGARSALFSPLPGIGLIIVDEEYDFSYKQEEGPRYQARDAAIVRGRMEKALVILGSGTPSIQSFHNSAVRRYHLIHMPHRIEKRPLPDVEVVDMKPVSKEGQGDRVFSPQLKEAIDLNLKEGKQAIIFLNRRGFSRFYLCRSCGESIRCGNCDLTLTYHLKENVLSCHYCGFSTRPRGNCPACGHEGMRAYGFGTERLERELTELFPTARVSRMDRDSTRRKGESFRILKSFIEGETDILVGTQMITKGYDFPNVTLVGVIAADLSLSFPDFRAGERTFQLLSQVAGRAGRGDRRGRVIVQTFNPGHYAITTAKDHDYEAFFQKELDLREQLGYPPFSYLACLRFQGNDHDATEGMAGQIGDEIRALLGRWPRRGRDVQVLGPAKAPLAKLKGKHRRQILLKSRGTELLHYLLREVEAISRKMLRGSGVAMIIDVDPYQML